MGKRTLERKTLLVSSRVPPRVGGTPHQLRMLFDDVDPACYAVYTNPHAVDARFHDRKLSGTYYFFPQEQGGIRWLWKTIRDGLRVMKKEKIEVIYAPTDGGTSFLVGFLLSRISRVPLVLHFLDIYRGNNFSFFYSLWASVLEWLVIKQASKVIICNDAIDAEYRRRYGNLSKFVLIQNSDSRERFDAIRTPYRPSAPYSIIFTGNIYWAQEESIVSMCEAVKLATIPITFTVYTPLPPERLKKRFESDRIRFRTGTPEKMPETQASADILFVPLSWPKESPIVTETALPGKLPEYLLAGRPILVQAPPNCYLVRYARKDGFAAVVTTTDPATLAKEIERIVTDIPYAEELVKNAFSTFTKHHDATINAKLVANVIASA